MSRSRDISGTTRTEFVFTATLKQHLVLMIQVQHCHIQ